MKQDSKFRKHIIKKFSYHIILNILSFLLKKIVLTSSMHDLGRGKHMKNVTPMMI